MPVTVEGAAGPTGSTWRVLSGVPLGGTGAQTGLEPLKTAKPRSHGRHFEFVIVRDPEFVIIKVSDLKHFNRR